MANESSNIELPALDLSQAPKVLYFYGLAGAGKNFVGDIAGRLARRHVYHADADLTPEMHRAVAEKRSFTPEMRDHYYAIVADQILRLRRLHGDTGLVVTQATYKIQHRNYLASKIEDMDMICVTANDSTIIQRLRNRGDAVTPEYAAVMRANFEPPATGSKVIVNNGGEPEIIQQLNEFYFSASLSN